MKLISANLVFRGALVTAVASGWLCAGGGVAQEAILGEIEVSVIHGSNAGSEDIQADWFLSDRPKKEADHCRTGFCELCPAEAKVVVVHRLDSNLPEIIAVLKRPPDSGQDRVLNLSARRERLPLNRRRSGDEQSVYRFA